MDHLVKQLNHCVLFHHLPTEELSLLFSDVAYNVKPIIRMRSFFPPINLQIL